MSPAKFAWREISARKTYALLYVFSCALGGAVVAALGGYGAAARQAVAGQARELWAADATVRGSEPLLDRLESWSRDQWPGLAAAWRVDVLSMVRADGGKVTQAALSAVTPNYPLHGRVLSASGKRLGDVLKPGRALAAPKLLAETSAAPGGILRLGTLDVTVEDAVASRTEAPFSFFELAPALFITPEDLRASGLVVPGSRTLNTLYLNFPPGTNLSQALERLRQQAGEETAEVSSWTSDNPGVLNFLQNALRFMDLLGLLSLGLGGVGAATALAAAMAASRRTQGLLLALGAPRSYLYKAWTAWIGILSLAGTTLALGIGWVGAQGLAGLFGDLLPVSVRPGIPWAALARAGAVSLGASVLFALAPLMKLTDLPPNAVFSGDVPLLPFRKRRLIVLGLLSAGVFFLLAWWEVGRPLLAAVFLAGTAAVLALAWGLSAGILGLLRRTLARRRGLAWRLAGRGLARPGGLNTAVAVSLSVSLSAVLALLLVQKNLETGLVRSFPADRPNVFFINIQTRQSADFRRILGQDVRLFPLIRGRVTDVNGVPARDIQARSERRLGPGDRLTREFGFTFGPDLLPTDRVVAGPGLWDPGVAGPQVSVFDEYRRRFGLRLGDRITVSVLGRRVAAVIGSFRSIDQSVRQPFFYFYFPPGVLDDIPHTLMAGARVGPAAIPDLENRLAQAMPNVTVLDLSEVAALTDRILRRLARVVHALGLFGTAAGLLLLLANLSVTLAARAREAVLYRTLGATLAQVARAFLAEYALLGAAAATVAGALGWTAAWTATRFALHLPFHPFLPLALPLLLAAAATVVLISLLATRPALRAAPMEVLRYE